MSLVHQRERVGTIPLPILKKWDDEHYCRKYAFVTVVRMRLSFASSTCPEAIVLFSYADLVDWSETVCQLVRDGVRMSFLFVPIR